MKNSKSNSHPSIPKNTTNLTPTHIQQISDILSKFYKINTTLGRILNLLNQDKSQIILHINLLNQLLTLQSQQNFQYNFQKFEGSYYKFINQETSQEIWIKTSGEIIFQQTGTNIQATFTPQNISELLNIQLFYFKESNK